MRYSLQFFESDGTVVRTLEWGCDDSRATPPLRPGVDRRRTAELRCDGQLVVRQQAKLGIDP